MKRGLQLLEAHMRSLDPDEPTARERLERALGEPFARELLIAARLGVRYEGTQQDHGGDTEP
jgi:uncharacterized protein (DUF1800 family)